MGKFVLHRGLVLLLTLTGLTVAAAPDQATKVDDHSLDMTSRVRRSLRVLKEAPGAMEGVSSAALKIGAVASIRSDASGGVAGTPPGTQVYRNDTNGSLIVYRPGAGQRMADDITLASGGCTATFYSLRVAGLNTTGTFDVHTALWNGDPCEPTSAIIAETEADFLGVPNNQNAFDLEVTLDPTIPVPATVWLSATFSTDDSGWIRAGKAEVGSTTNVWSENNVGDPGTGCDLFQFNANGVPWAGFWASLNCSLPGDPIGACCEDVTCTQTTQADCTVGVWQGAFTTCQPNVCLSGACCTGGNFAICADATEDQCVGGLFHAGSTCAEDACGPTFKVYENSFATGIFDVIADNTKWADDLILGAGAPCELAGYEVLAAGDGETGPSTFGMHVELWTNDEQGTPTAADDDIPAALIPGTQFDFANVPADLFTQRLLAGPFMGIELPDKVWVVMTTTSDNSGPLPAGPASVGFSVDGFAIFNATGAPNVWTPGFWYDGFDPQFCPGPDCTPAGSFRVQVWCHGNPPTGACCNDSAGTCIDGIREAECNGRWAEDVGCDPDPFDPPCGTGACCYPIEIPPNPPVMVCQDTTPGECATLGDPLGSAFSRGNFCGDVVCPPVSCLGGTGDCFSSHAGTGCEDAYCCGVVCDPVTGDPFCCDSEWDAACAQDAVEKCDHPLQNDNCAGSQDISGAGTFGFENSIATTDGPVHLGCGTLGGDEQITRDVWYCWTSPCTSNVLVRTCGQTQVDTKLAVYDGCTCPPTDGNLLDCDDDRCSPFQSMGLFSATAGHEYLIRLGSYPGQAGGTGTFSISCGAPPVPACESAAGNCCAAGVSSACDDSECCNTVCACDPYCCDTEWDNACATTGAGDNHCGAAELCPSICAPTCPAGAVTWLDPPNGVVDAGRPHAPGDPSALQGIKVITVQAPSGADKAECWQLCETAVAGTPNGVESVLDLGRGQFKVTLKRPITPGAGTTLTYAGTGAMATFYSHPGNVNGDGLAAPVDILDLIDNLNGVKMLPFGLYSGDIDRSNLIAPADILEEIDLLNGASGFQVWNGTAKAVTAGICP